MTGVCLENWQIDCNTNLEEIACDYFYKQSDKKQRYPEDETQKFAPGEYYRHLNPNADLQNLFILSENDSLKSLNSLEKNNNSLNESIDELEEKDSNFLPMAIPSSQEEKSIPSSNSQVTPRDRWKSKNFLIQLSVAFIFGTIVTAIALGQILKKPSNNSVADELISCDYQLIQQAEDAIFVRDATQLTEIMSLLKDFNSPLGGFGDEKCRQTLYEVKFTYAIEVKANKEHNLLEAVKILCEIPEQYYQSKQHKPWFSRWANSFSNTSFPEQLDEYIEIHGCPAADYLYQ